MQKTERRSVRDEGEQKDRIPIFDTTTIKDFIQYERKASSSNEKRRYNHSEEDQYGKKKSISRRSKSSSK